LKKIKELYEKYREIIAYLFWGVCTTCVSWGTYTLFAGVLHTPFEIANVLSWIFAVLFAYFTNKIWVFRSKCWRGRAVVREFCLFISSRLATGVLEIVLVPLLVYVGMNQTIFGIEGSLAKIVVSIFVILANYILSKIVIFKNKGERK
jgi:putative flippase GtrA